jgi:hypothetical protein
MTLRHGWIVAILATLTAGAAPPALAQLDANLGALSGSNAQGYLGPILKPLSGALNSAVFQTGDVGRVGPHIAFGVRLMGVTISDELRTYTPTDPPGFTGTEPVQAPTVFGDPQAVMQQGQGGATLYHPGGFDIQNFALAVPQLSIGTVLGTRAVARYFKVNLGESDFGEVEIFGIGAQHSISQYFSVLPVDLAAGVFYQEFSIKSNLVDTQAINYNLTASKRIGLLEPYVGIGYDTFKMNVSYESSTQPGQKIEIKFDDQKSTRFTAGSRLALGFVKISAEINSAAETVAAVGLSIGN